MKRHSNKYQQSILSTKNSLAGQIDYVQPQQYPLLQLQFGIQLATLTLHDATGETIQSFDIGTPAQEPYMLEGTYPSNPHRESKGRTRWLGGPTAQTMIGFEPQFSAATSATLRGIAPEFSDQPIDVGVVVKEQKIDHIAVEPELDSYSISLQHD